MSSPKRKPFQRIRRFSEAGNAARSIELFEDNVAKKFRDIDAMNDSSTSLAGDVGGTLDDNTVEKLQGYTLSIGTPVTGQVLMYDGTKFTPISLNPRVLDTTYAPVGLWNFHLGATGGLKDYSGNGRDLSVEAGTARYTHIAPALGGLHFDGSTNLYYPTPQTDFNIVGDLTVLVLMVLHAYPGTSTYLVSNSKAFDGTSASNHAFNLGLNSSGGGSFFSKHGAGVVDGYTINSGPVPGVLSLYGVTRTSNVVQFYQNGRALDGPSSTLTAPDGGSGALFRIGKNSDGSVACNATIASVGLYNFAMSVSEIVERYNYCLGRVGGYIS